MTRNTSANPGHALLGAAAFAAMTVASISQAMADTAYVQTLVDVPHRDVPVKLDIYYPSTKGGRSQIHGENIVFTGIRLNKGASPLPGRHPVVFFSHGSGGNGINTGWFLKALAEAGMIAIAPNHPGSTSRDSDPEQSLKTWERPQDISALIDQLPDLLPEGLKADETRIGAAGFSLGGYSVMSLAGARLNKADFITHCEASFGEGLNECDWFTKDGYDLNEIDRQGFEQSNLDPRISAVVAIDPGFAAAFSRKSLNAVSTPVQIINLGSDGKVYAGIDGAPLVQHMPDADFERVENSWHFSFLGECKWTGPILLAVTFDDPICRDVADRERKEVHKEVAEKAVAFLENRLAPTN